MASRSDQPRALVTGLKGFTGAYLVAELRAAGYKVFGTAHASSLSCDEGVYQVDLCDRAGLRDVVEDVRPTVVAHLAGISFVGYGDAEAIYRVNIVGTRNLLEALAGLPELPKSVLLVSSANIYGNTAEGMLDESTPANPANDYAVSKLAMEYMARLWMDRLPIVIVRPFNYTGVGQSVSFLLPKIVSHFQRHEPVIELGNIDVERDFSDVRMVVKAYIALLEKAPKGAVFNVCSGSAWSLKQVLKVMAEIAGYEIEVRVNPAFVRANEVKRLLGDAGKLHRVIGKLDRIDLKDTLRWMLTESQ
ncbi:GDP-mannose 4,6-dehydratase [Nitrosomonas eutropha]|uniref:GDP-mannose 4,6-dehydratase n=1 Tax=Nitrosomonas eutropha TaxID=916 RepID=UPI002108DB35|nr:GDP-mannose 4,6-dehydratase [Nitrosomonas eutropha]